MNERERERERETDRQTDRENGEIKRKPKKLKEKAQETVCLETAIKFSIDSLCPKFLHLSMQLSLLVT